MSFAPHAGNVVDVVHDVICRHQVEVRVRPARAELYFRDEAYESPFDKQLRFEATVINSDAGVTFDVQRLDGGTGAGTIDASGLYRAPTKGGITSGHTDVVVVKSREDPLRKAFAWVTLIGDGPEPPPPARVEVWPGRVNLYYPQGHHNAYMDATNTRQLFEARIWASAATSLEWRVDGVLQPTGASWFNYQAAGSGVPRTVVVEARLAGAPAVRDEARISLSNYLWPGLM